MPFDLDEKFVADTEKKIGARLPESYRSKMKAENGGTIETDSDEWFLYPIFDGSAKKRIARTCNDVLQENSSMKEWPNWPENAFAIANNGCGDALAFLIRDCRAEDTVYVWKHETGDLKKLADDFGVLETG